jgi:hypothetical protein
MHHMLERYRPVVASLPLHHASFLRSRFHLRHDLQLHDALQHEGLDQADVVLALLRAGRHDAVKLFVNWTVCPPQAYPQRLLPLPRRERSPDDRFIHRLSPTNPLTIPSARARWEIMARCRTIGSYAARVPRWLALRDVREWSRAGWLRVAA